MFLHASNTNQTTEKKREKKIQEKIMSSNKWLFIFEIGLIRLQVFQLEIVMIGVVRNSQVDVVWAVCLLKSHK